MIPTTSCLLAGGGFFDSQEKKCMWEKEDVRETVNALREEWRSLRRNVDGR